MCVRQPGFVLSERDFLFTLLFIKRTRALIAHAQLGSYQSWQRLKRGSQSRLATLANLALLLLSRHVPTVSARNVVERVKQPAKKLALRVRSSMFLRVTVVLEHGCLGFPHNAEITGKTGRITSGVRSPFTLHIVPHKGLIRWFQSHIVSEVLLLNIFFTFNVTLNQIFNFKRTLNQSLLFWRLKHAQEVCLWSPEPQPGRRSGWPLSHGGGS